MAISMLKIRRPLGRLIFNMGIAIPGKTVFLIETAPRTLVTHMPMCFLSQIIVIATVLSKWIRIRFLLFIITRVSEVIMFSPCVFVCLFVTLCLYHDVCPDNLTMKDCCHTNNILQVHFWGCLVVQVMFHALMTSSMTSPGHKVGQILKVIYLRQYLN